MFAQASGGGLVDDTCEGQRIPSPGVLDNLLPQVHGDVVGRPVDLDGDVELLHGDVRDADAVARALDGVDRVVHLAARVGVGQSMYEIAEYTSVNSVGTAVVLEALAKRRVAQLVVASSMSVYGEGLYHDPCGRPAPNRDRSRDELATGQWEAVGIDGTPLTPVPTPGPSSPR